MRRFISLILCIACLVLLMPVQDASAAEYAVERIVLEGGNYIVVTTTAIDSRAVSTRSGTKSYTYYNSNNIELWKATLTGRFRHNGFSSECLDAVCSVTIYNDSWSLASKTATHSGSTANATVKMQLRSAGVVVGTETCNISLFCDANGNIY